MSLPNLLNFRLDSYCGSGDPSGKIIMDLTRKDDHMVLDALVCDIDVASINEILNAWGEEHGGFAVVQKFPHVTTGAEHIHYAMDKEYEEFKTKRDAEQAAHQLERDLEQAGKVYEMLMSSSFETWYPGAFMDHVEGEEGALDKNAILIQLVRML